MMSPGSNSRKGIEAPPVLPIQREDGLVLRCGSPADLERLPDFNARIHGEESPDTRVGALTRDLLSGCNPHFHPGDFTVVEEPRSGKIVSSACLLSQTWSFAGIPFSAGQPELVGTDPDYRNRGLVRAQFEILHRWSRARDQVLTGITGIPWYYRQFDYEMTVDLDGGRIGYAANVPALAEGQEELFRFRAASAADIPFLQRCYQHGCQRSLIACARDEQEWFYEVAGRSPDSADRSEILLIERRRDGEPVGFLGHKPWLEDDKPVASVYELAPQASWGEVTPSVIRLLWQIGQRFAQVEGKTCQAFALMLGEEHPAYKIASAWLPRKRDSYAWYIRVPDLKAFLRRIAPALQARLQASPYPGYSGDLTLGFYRSALRLKFERGFLAAVEDWQHDSSHWPDAAFPGLVFLQALTGYRSLDELEYASADCIVGERVHALMDALFPKLPSTIWPLI